MKKDYGAVVIARDEERNIEACLSALTNSEGCSIHVVVDSRTVDRTAELAQNYTAQVYVIEGNRGRLRNEGYKRLGLPFVAFVDADMIVTPGYLESLRRAMTEDSGLGVAVGAQIPLGCCRLGALDCEYWNYRRATPAGGSMFRVAAVEQVRGFRDDLNVGEDGELIGRMLAKGWRKRWLSGAVIGHHYAKNNEVWLNKVTHGLSAGMKTRGVVRLLASPIIGIHAAVERRQPHMLWYVPLRSLTLLAGPGAKSEYGPGARRQGGL